MLTDWMTVEKEKELVKERYKSNRYREILPILMCPDDCDFSCTIIVAEVVKDSEFVTWERIGVNVKGLAEIDLEVNWLDKLPRMSFRRSEYESLDQIYCSD